MGLCALGDCVYIRDGSSCRRRWARVGGQWKERDPRSAQPGQHARLVAVMARRPEDP
jgi:hypothetical protein